MSETIDALLTVARCFAAARSLSLSRVSTLVFNDGSKLGTLATGDADIGTRRLVRAMAWFSQNWPEGAAWPDGIDRPAEPDLNTGTPEVWSPA